MFAAFLYRTPIHRRIDLVLAQPLVVLGSDTTALLLRGRRLAQVVAEDGEPYHEIFPLVTDSLFREGVHGVERVNPDVSFGVPLGVLRAADQGLELRRV